MLRLKVGKNFLLLNYQSNERSTIDRAIPYMMGCFEGTNLLASCLSYHSFDANEVCKNMESLKTNKLYLLQYVDVLGMKHANDKAYLREVIMHNREVLKQQIAKIKEINLKDEKPKLILEDESEDKKQYMCTMFFLTEEDMEEYKAIGVNKMVKMFENAKTVKEHLS